MVLLVSKKYQNKIQRNTKYEELLKYNSSLSYYINTRSALSNIVNQRVKLETSNREISYLTVLRPNRWIREFLNSIYGNTINNLFVEHTFNNVPEATTGPVTSMTVQNYFADLHHIVARFAASVSILPFYSERGSNCPYTGPTVFADSQLLIHFSAYRSKQISYQDFVMNEYSYRSGTKFNMLSQAVRETVQLVSCFKDVLIFEGRERCIVPVINKNNDNESAELVSESDVTVVKGKMAVVPPRFMEVLRAFMYDNVIMSGIRRTKTTDEENLRIEDITPIGCT